MPVNLKYLKLFVLLMTLACSHALGRTVVIDAGHGGQDIGGSHGRVYEKHLALDTALRLEYYLKRKGYRVIMTRRSDHFVTLSRRMAIANRYPRAIFVSIHYNQSWRRGASGLETFYNTGKSLKLAQAVHGEMVKKVPGKNRGVKKARYYVVRNCRIPSILVEGGFVSHRSERARMKKAWYRNNIARGIAKGIDRYWKVR